MDERLALWFVATELRLPPRMLVTPPKIALPPPATCVGALVNVSIILLPIWSKATGVGQPKPLPPPGEREAPPSLSKNRFIPSLSASGCKWTASFRYFSRSLRSACLVLFFHEGRVECESVKRVPVITEMRRRTSCRVSKSVYLRTIIHPGKLDEVGSIWIM